MNITFTKKTWMHLAVAFSLLGALTTVARAESFSIDVPFAFEAGGKSFPAGAYSVDPVSSGVLVIRGAAPAEAAALSVSPAGYTDSTKMGLVFDRNAETPMLSAVKLPSGLVVTVIPAVPTKGVALSHP
jgi:hypothetical protein